MDITRLNHIKNFYKPITLVLLISVVLSLTACADPKPDYEFKRLRVDALNTNVLQGNNTKPIWRTGWRFEFQVINKGGKEGLGPDEFGNRLMIPVAFSAFIPNDRELGCPSASNSDGVTVNPGPTEITLQAWREVPVSSSSIYSFSNVFITNTNPPQNCVPESVLINWDSSKPPGKINTINESDITNNTIRLDITNWPLQKTWVKEIP